MSVSRKLVLGQGVVSVAASNVSASLCNGRRVVGPGADWVWSTAVHSSYSCSSPPMQNVGQMCDGDPTSIVMMANGEAQCLSTTMDCTFNMHDLVQLDFDVQMQNCKGTWAAPLWMSPNHWEGGGYSGEIDMLENCPTSQVKTNFAGGGDSVAWTNNPDDFSAHVTMWKQDDGNGIQSIHVASCQSVQADGSCSEDSAAYLHDIYGLNGCSRGDCIYHFISDIWNGVDGDDGFTSCAGRKTNYGSRCAFSITNIRTQGIPFSGKCGALTHNPAPTPPAPTPSPPSPSPSSWMSIVSKKSGKCLDLKDGDEYNGAALQVWSCDAGNPDWKQRWLHRGNEVLHRTSAGGELCVDIPSNYQYNGALLQVWQCGGTPQQQWQISQDKLRIDNQCMDLVDGGTGDGVPVQIWECDSPTPQNQEWIFNVVGEETFDVVV